MWHALFRQARADLRSRPLQSLQIVVIVAAVTTTLTMGVGMARGASILWDRIFDASNGAHVLLVAAGPQADVSGIARQPQVAASAPTIPLVRGLKLAQDPRKVELWLQGLEAEASIGRPLVVEGAWIAPDRSDQVVLDANFARDLALRIGDDVELFTPGRRVRLTLVGLAVSPMFPYPSNAPAGYVSRAGLTRIEDPARWEALLSIRLRDPAQSVSFVERTSVIYGPLLSYSREWQRTRTAVEFNNNVSILLVRVVSLLALLAGGLIVANTTSALVLARLREIGLLKAIGYTPRQVTALFVVEHLALGLVGVGVGIATGLALLPALFTSAFLRRTAEMLSLDLVLAAEPLGFVLITLWIEFVVLCFTLVPAWRGGRIGTVPAMLLGTQLLAGRRSRLGSLAARLGQPPAVVLGLRNAFARPGRARLTVASLALTVSLATVVLAGESTLNAYAESPPLLGLPPHHLLLRRGLVSHADTERILARHPEVTRTVAATSLPALTAAQSAVPIAARGVVAPVDLSAVALQAGRMFQGPGETIVTQAVLDRLDLEIGDELPLRVFGAPLTLRIVGRYYGTENLGMVLLFDLETARQQVDRAIEPTDYFLSVAPEVNRRNLEQALLRDSDDRFGILRWTAGGEVERIRNTIRTLGVALVLISLINLLNTALLGVREQIRATGVLRALGMTPRQLTVSVGITALIQTLAAVVMGAPLGIGLTYAMWIWITRQGGGGYDVPIPVTWTAIIGLILLGALGVALVSAAIPARRAVRLPVTEALRHE